MHIQLQKHTDRKASQMDGWIYLGGKPCKIIVKHLALSGALVLLDPDSAEDNQRRFKRLSVAKTVDFFLPSQGMSGIADIARVTMTEHGVVAVRLAFQDVAHPVDRPYYYRNDYRSEIAVPGKIQLNGHYMDFLTINISVDGLMIHLPHSVDIEIGLSVKFKFPHAKRKGMARVMWAQNNEDHETLMGLQLIRRDLLDKPGQQATTHQPPVAGSITLKRHERAKPPISRLQGLSLAVSRPGVSASKSPELPSVQFEPLDDWPGDNLFPAVPSGACIPTPLFCGENWVSKVSKPAKMRQW
ncbi:MAG: PilZ domain-containing protein [Methylovulum sp.]|nr:PilZ domain-containing protein [Methylovulum sp.]